MMTKIFDNIFVLKLWKNWNFLLKWLQSDVKIVLLQKLQDWNLLYSHHSSCIPIKTFINRTILSFTNQLTDLILRSWFWKKEITLHLHGLLFVTIIVLKKFFNCIIVIFVISKNSLTMIDLEIFLRHFVDGKRKINHGDFRFFLPHFFPSRDHSSKPLTYHCH